MKILKVFHGWNPVAKNDGFQIKFSTGHRDYIRRHNIKVKGGGYDTEMVFEADEYFDELKDDELEKLIKALRDYHVQDTSRSQRIDTQSALDEAEKELLKRKDDKIKTLKDKLRRRNKQIRDLRSSLTTHK